MGVGVVTSRREQFLDAAEACFARRGFHATTVTDISAAAGCSPGLLYRYFSGKDALVEALVERDTRRYVTWLRAVRAADDPMAALRDLLNRALTGTESRGDGADGRLAEEPEEHRAPAAASLHLEIDAEAARNPALAAIIRRATADLLDALAEALRAGQATGAFDQRLDPTVTARVLLAVVDGLGAQGALDPEYRPSTQAAVVGDLLEHLLAPRPDRASAHEGTQHG